MTRARITPTVMRVFDVLEEAAARGEPCPGNTMLAARLHIGTDTTVEAVKALERAGLIQVWRYTSRRVVRIIATGRQTAGDTAKPQRVYGPGSRGAAGAGALARAVSKHAPCRAAALSRSREIPPPVSIRPAAGQAAEPASRAACAAPPPRLTPNQSVTCAAAGLLSPIIPVPGETVAAAIVRAADDAVVADDGSVLRQPVGVQLRNLRGAITRHTAPPESRARPAAYARGGSADRITASIAALAPGITPARVCQWPMWPDDAPRAERGRFCGDDPAFPGCSYCERHRLQARGIGTPTERRAEKILLAHAGG